MRSRLTVISFNDEPISENLCVVQISERTEKAAINGLLDGHSTNCPSNAEHLLEISWISFKIWTVIWVTYLHLLFPARRLMKGHSVWPNTYSNRELLKAIVLTERTVHIRWLMIFASPFTNIGKASRGWIISTKFVILCPRLTWMYASLPSNLLKYSSIFQGADRYILYWNRRESGTTSAIVSSVEGGE
jgi:hypothetical protein